MHKRTKACAITPRTKKIVWDRDGGRCIFGDNRPALPEAHVISRAHGGMGIPENIITVCRLHHDMMDNSPYRQVMVEFAKDYLRKCYPGWKEENVIYDKWKGMKDDGKSISDAVDR